MDSDEEDVVLDAEELARSLQAMPTWHIDEVEVSEEPLEEPPQMEEPPMPLNEPKQPKVDLQVAQEESAPPPLLRILEAMLFVGDGPLTESRARGTIRGLTSEEFLSVVDELNRIYRAQGRPYLIRKRNQGFELTLRRSFASLQEKMRGTVREARLSPSAIEVLALVAYQQPVARQDVDSLRGADSTSSLRLLVRHGLIAVQREAGDKEARYVTTAKFLETFQLSSLNDLPRMQELHQL